MQIFAYLYTCRYAVKYMCWEDIVLTPASLETTEILAK